MTLKEAKEIQQFYDQMFIDLYNQLQVLEDKPEYVVGFKSFDPEDF